MKNCRESKNPGLKKVWKTTCVLTLFLTGMAWFACVMNVVAGETSNPAAIKQQQVRVTGKVTDQNRNPLPGVTILVKGTTRGTVTGADGAFSLSIPENKETLQFSFIGMQTQEVAIRGRSAFTVVMQQETIGLEEVVAVGYGTKRRADISGSVSVVEVDKLNAAVATSAAEALQGFASGVVVQTTGLPGGTNKIQIRGVTNFGNTYPLVIVDGIEQSLDHINANDIESIQVLKDAGSASIYGVRGANGVILVTTKKGKIGAPVLTYEGYYGVQHTLQGNPFDLLNSEDFMKVYNIGFPNNQLFARGMPDYMYRGPGGAGVAFEGDPAVDPGLYYLEIPNRGKNYLIQKVNKEGTDWFHELFKNAPMMEHNLSASGGTNKSKLYMALSYVDQKGTLIETWLKRYTFRVKTEFDLGKNIKIGENANFYYIDQSGLDINEKFGGIAEVYKQYPITPVKDIMGNWGGTFAGIDLGSAQNPVATQTRGNEKDLSHSWRTLGNIYLEYDFLKNFKARTSAGFSIHHSYNQDYSETQVENVQSNTNNNKLGLTSNYNTMMTFTNTLNYIKKFGRHEVEALLGTEAIRDYGRDLGGSREKFTFSDFNFLILNAGTEQILNSSSISEERLYSLFSRLDYNYMKKYIFSATLRRDGSSKFGIDKRYGIFPSFSLAWRMSDENFMKNLSMIDDLKLRGSYGVLGNKSNVSAINQYSLYHNPNNVSWYNITGEINVLTEGWALSRIGNPSTGWEENIVSNLGFDMIAFDNTIDFSLEYYKKKIQGLLFTEPLPAVVSQGFSTPTVNIGNIENSGIDISFIYRGTIKTSFKYSIGTNITSYNNKIVELPDPGYFGSGYTRNEEGHPIGSFYGYKVLGLFNSQEEVDSAPLQNFAAPGRFKFQDTDGDKEITPNDRVFLGDPNPKFTYGLNISLSYKNFSLLTNFYGVDNIDIYNNTRFYLNFFSYYPGQKSNVLLNAWTPENTDTTVPKIEATQNFSTTSYSSYFVEDGSYLRCKLLMLTYTLNPAILQKVGLSKLSLYSKVTNLFTITNYTGLDPELPSGHDWGNYPNSEKKLIFGITMTF
jgi:TonB-linked SusC/RagA family outer membrane protein